MKDLVGRRYGKLVVVELMGVFKGHSKWICRCDCGQSVEIHGTNLSVRTDCGCGNREKILQDIRGYIGQKYGRLLIVDFAGMKRNARQYSCLCDCGNKKVVYLSNLKRGITTSCGCYHVEEFKKRTTKHGKYKDGNKKDPERCAWNHMLHRCYDPKDKRYHRYGARGITVCDRWRESFDNFFSDMGYRPSDEHSLDRKDNDGNYEPSNCRWGTEEIQKRNRGNNHWVEYMGRKMILSDWAREIGVSCSTFNNAFKRGDEFGEIYERIKNRKK